MLAGDTNEGSSFPTTHWTLVQVLREEVALTVLSPEEIAGEMAWLQKVLGGK